MIDKKQIEWYFNWMKSKGVISEGWTYYSFNIRNDKVIIHSKHQIKDKMGYVTQKNSSYAFDKGKILVDIREAKLRQLFD